MKIDNHVFTVRSNTPKGVNFPKLAKTFKKNGPFNMQSPPLAGRVTTPTVTQRSKDLSKDVNKIAQKIPTPFLVNPKHPSAHDNR
ncbi:MAG: hypothetical protein ACRDFB_05640 [Rhabdochlamydiaceae bacterium]